MRAAITVDVPSSTGSPVSLKNDLWNTATGLLRTSTKFGIVSEFVFLRFTELFSFIAFSFTSDSSPFSFDISRSCTFQFLPKIPETTMTPSIARSWRMGKEILIFLFRSSLSDISHPQSSYVVISGHFRLYICENVLLWLSISGWFIVVLYPSCPAHWLDRDSNADICLPGNRRWFIAVINP